MRVGSGWLFVCIFLLLSALILFPSSSPRPVPFRFDGTFSASLNLSVLRSRAALLFAYENVTITYSGTVPRVRSFLALMVILKSFRYPD